MVILGGYGCQARESCKCFCVASVRTVERGCCNAVASH
jgi:hypothetical protein